MHRAPVSRGVSGFSSAALPPAFCYRLATAPVPRSGARLHLPFHILQRNLAAALDLAPEVNGV